MNNNYNFEISLVCPTCGSADNFEYNDDKTYIKCTKCNREFFGGLEELKELNQDRISYYAKEVIFDDVKKDLKDSLTKAFRGNKYVKIK